MRSKTPAISYLRQSTIEKAGPKAGALISASSSRIEPKGAIDTVQFANCCAAADSNVGAHTLRILPVDPARLKAGVAAAAAVAPSRYPCAERVAATVRRLGRPETAEFVEVKLRATKSCSVGEVGLGLGYRTDRDSRLCPGHNRAAALERHRNMALRGDDVIDIQENPQTGGLFFLETEAKSRVALSASVIPGAPAGLDKYGGLPSAHSMLFIADPLTVRFRSSRRRLLPAWGSCPWRLAASSLPARPKGRWPSLSWAG